MISVAAGQEVNHAITVSNAIPVHYSALGLPNGLSIDGQTGVISGAVNSPLRAAVQVMVETTQSRLVQSMSVIVGSGAAPVDIALSSPVLMENSPAGTVIGLLSAMDPDSGDTHVFSLVAGNGELDNARFRIEGSSLVLNEKIDRDFEKDTNPFIIRVRATDSSLNPFEKVLQITFLDDRTEDADGDGLTEAQEEDQYGTRDTKYDMDGDGFGDGFEVSRGTLPLSAGSVPAGQQLVAWGSSGSGQTTVPNGLGAMTALECGWKHNLGLREDGTAAAWGANDEGQCHVPEGLAGVVEIAAGDLHSLALKGDGTLAAWGYDNLGQGSVPPGLDGIVSIAAGSYHNLALRNDGTVVAWGDNEAGECNVPAGLSGVVAIAAGGYHSLALKGDGTVIAWGDSSAGATLVPQGLVKVIAIAAGGFHSLALKSDGTVVAWGNASEGQSLVPMGLSGVIDIKAGWMHSLAMKNDGTLVTWGSNAKGQSSIPLEARNVRAIATGDFHNLAARQAGGFPRIPPGIVVQGWAGQTVNQSFSPENATAALYSALGLPEGLSISPETGVVTGAPVGNSRRAVRIVADTDKGRLSRVVWFDMAAGSAPTGITLAPVPPAATLGVLENSPPGTVIGTLSVTDPDEGDSHIFHATVTSGLSQLYGLQVSGNQLVLAEGAPVDYETSPSLGIRIRAIDSAGNTLERTFSIPVVDDRTEDSDGDGVSQALEQDVFFTSDSQFTAFATADADKDGIPVMIEYAFNLNMRVADAGKYLGGAGSTSGLPVVSLVTDGQGNRRLRLEYLRRIGSVMPNLAYAPQFANSPAGPWSSAAGAVTVTPVDSSWERCSVDDPQTTTGTARRFARVKISW